MEQRRFVFNKREDPFFRSDNCSLHLYLENKRTIVFHQTGYQNKTQDLQLKFEDIKKVFLHYFFAKKTIVSILKNKSEYIAKL